MTEAAVKALTDFVSSREDAGQCFREMYDILPVAICTTDASGRVTYFNDAAVELFGRAPQLGTDQWCANWKMFRPDGTPLPRDQFPMAVVLRGGKAPSGIEGVTERPDGRLVWFTQYATALRNSAGEITGSIHILIEITDRKLAEIDNDQPFRAIVETTPECVKIVAPDGKLLLMNSQGLRIIGAPSAEAVAGLNVYDLVAPEDLAKFREMNERVCNGEKASIEFDIIGLQGERRRMETHATPLRQRDGTTAHLAFTRDITDRAKAERDTLLLGAIVENSDDAIISKDLNGIITSWNSSGERLFGYTAEEIVGKPITLLIPPDHLDEEPQILARLRRGERVDHIETRRVRKDGTLLDISLTISPVKDSSGKVIGASKIARDITDRKRIEVRQKQIENELRRANEDLEQFAYSASHDLQEPLRSVKIFSELLTTDYGDAFTGEAREFLKHLRTGASRMEMLVHDLLSYTQVMKFDKPAELADTGAALSAALANLTGTIEEAGAKVTSDPLPSLYVHGAHLQQLFQNLIGNAVKYRSPDRAPVIHVGASRGDGHWDFSVSDNGIGIDPEYREKIFGLFNRLHTNDQYSGTGLGLAICQRIVGRYQGRIWVDSVPGKGSTFRFLFPD